MADITITHTAADGTLIEGTSKGDGTNIILKTAGFRWFRTLGTWGIAGSRDHQPNDWKIERARKALTDAGHTVTLDIDRTHRDTATAEADKARRANDRADAIAAKAQRHRDNAEAAWDAERRAVAALPEGGEPIKVGHHSERRHRKAIDTAWDKLGKAVEAERLADDTARRAAIAAQATDHRNNPRTVANRIDKLEAEQRGDQRRIDGATRTLFTDSTGQRQTEETSAASGDYRDRILARMAERADQIDHWKAVRAAQIATGAAGDYSPATISKGDRIRTRWNDWCTVLRVNKKTVSIEQPTPYGGRMIRGTIPYQEITGHKPASAQLDEHHETTQAS